jgi:hypothetical protein
MLNRVPKISLYALVILAFAMLATVTSQLADPDFFWHLRAGQWMIENGKIPENDPFLWSQTSTPWMNHEWLSDIVFFALHKAGGGTLISIFVGLLFGGTLTLLYTFLKFKASPFMAILFTSLGAAVILPWAGCRPQSITYFLFTVFLFTLLRYQGDFRVSRLWILPPLMILWANLHGAFIIGIVLLGMFAGLMTLDAFWNTGLREWRRCFRKVNAIWACWLVTTIAACLTPYGPKLLIHPFKVMKLWIVPYIAEWQPAVFGQLASASLFVLIGLWILIQIFRTSKPSLFELALPFVFTVLSLSQIRQAPLAAIALCASMAPQLNDVCSTLLTLLRSKIKTGKLASKASQDLGPIQYVVNGMLAIVGVIGMVILLNGKLDRQLKQMDPMIGHSAIDFLAKRPQSGPIFNDYGYGGYLTWRLWPEQQAFIDGRADMYSDQFAKDYVEIIFGKPDWKPRFDRYRFNTVVIGREGALRQLLLAEDEFSEVFSDDKVVVLIRKKTI